MMPQQNSANKKVKQELILTRPMEKGRESQHFILTPIYCQPWAETDQGDVL